MAVRTVVFYYILAGQNLSQLKPTNTMKRSIFLLICFCVLGFDTLTIRAFNPRPTFVNQTSDDLPPSYDQIVLYGNLLLGVGPNAVEVGYNENSVYIQFNQNLGYVDVTIYNPSGLTVYSDVVNTAVQQQVIVPITGLVDGVYTIVLENATGYADGEFEKDSNHKPI